MMYQRQSDAGLNTQHDAQQPCAAGALLTGFLLIERRVRDPLIPLHIFRLRAVALVRAPIAIPTISPVSRLIASKIHFWRRFLPTNDHSSS
jgi:hypothetical protein